MTSLKVCLHVTFLRLVHVKCEQGISPCPLLPLLNFSTVAIGAGVNDGTNLSLKTTVVITDMD